MIKQKETHSKMQIDLDGPQGNAFYLIGAASSIAKQLGHDVIALRGRMMSGDYKNVVSIIDKEYSDYIELYSSDPASFNED